MCSISPVLSRTFPAPIREASTQMTPTQATLDLGVSRYASASPSNRPQIISQLSLSSPFPIHPTTVTRKNDIQALSVQGPLQLDDVFSSVSFASSSKQTSSSTLVSSREDDRKRPLVTGKEKSSLHYSEQHRPEYLRRFERSSTDDELSLAEKNDKDFVRPSIGVVASPNKGRRLKLFHETSDESFEESLMTGGYERYVFVRPLSTSVI